jgi:hypothetical protein
MSAHIQDRHNFSPSRISHTVRLQKWENERRTTNVSTADPLANNVHGGINGMV